MYATINNACKNGNIDEVDKVISELESLIESKVKNVYVELDMLYKQFSGTTEDTMWWIFNYCLHTACRKGDYKTVKLMLDKGALFTDEDYEGYAGDDDDIYGDYREYGISLDNACKKGYFITIKLVTKTDFYDWDRGLLAACRSGNKQIIKYMVSKGATDWEECLEDVCERGDFKMAKFVIKNCINEKNNNRFRNGFISACMGGYTEIVELMITNGVNDWNAGLRYACRGGHFEIVEFLISKGADDWYDGFDSACKKKSVEIAKFMISKGVDLDFALITASEYSFLEIVKFIILTNQHQFSVVDLNRALQKVSGSCWGGEQTVEIAKLLMSEGATNLTSRLPYAYDHMHMSFFHYILDNNNDLTVELLNRVLCRWTGSYKHDYLRILLINKGADLSNLEVSKCLSDAKSFQLYCLYCRKSKKDVLDKEKFDKLLKVYPPYVLLKVSRASKICTSRLPSDLFRILFTYLH